LSAAGVALATCAFTLSLSSATPASATTTTTVPVTTTTVPVTTTTTTTTTSTTTTTTVPKTTTTVPKTTTTVPNTTTTTTTPKKTSSGLSSAAVALIIVAIVVVLAVILLLVLLSRRRRQQALAAWRRSVLPAVSDAHLARDALLSPNAMSDDPELRGSVEVLTDRSARALEQAALTAPDEVGQSAANSVARSLRGLAFAVEADRLLRHGAGAPSGTQLAEADDARRSRLAELDSGLSRLSAQLGAPSSRR
jgi:C4-dicarboxylate-specific signal transduction histidine kinase